MKSYGALRKLMLIVLLSILGSYCIGSDSSKSMDENSYNSVIKSTYSMVISFGAYCNKLWLEFVSQIMTAFGKKQDQSVKIQNVDDEDEPTDNYRCTDGAIDCKYNGDFFTDTWFTGKMDEDSTSHLDADSHPMKFVEN